MTFPLSVQKRLRRGGVPAFVATVPHWFTLVWTTAFAVLLLASSARADLLVLESGYSGHGPGVVSRLALPTGDARAPLFATNESYQAVCTAPDGTIYVTANLAGYGLIYRFARSGELLGTCGDVAQTQFEAVAAAADGSIYLVGVRYRDDGTSTRAIFRGAGRSGAQPVEWIAAGTGRMYAPVALTVGPDGFLYVADLAAGVLRFDLKTGAYAGVTVRLGTGGLRTPTGLAFGPDQRLYVGAAAPAAVLRFDPNTGRFIDVFVAQEPGSGPVGVRALAFGPDGHLYTLSAGQHEVVCYDGATGQPRGTVAGSSKWQRASGLAFAAAEPSPRAQP